MCAVVLLVLYLLACPSADWACPAYGVTVSDVSAFLEGRTPLAVRLRLSESVRRDGNAASWVTEHEGYVYSLCAVEVRRDKSQSMQNALMSSASSQAAMKASAGLAVYLDGGRMNPELYENREAFNHVLTSHYEAKAKFRSASKITGMTAFSLVWCEKVSAPVSEEEFNDKYCNTLYEWEGY